MRLTTLSFEIWMNDDCQCLLWIVILPALTPAGISSAFTAMIIFVVPQVGLRHFDLCHDNHPPKTGEGFLDPETGVKFQFALRADMAPIAFRKSAFLHLGGFDETLSEAGECGIGSDWDITHRMWVAGYAVSDAAIMCLFLMAPFI